MVLGKLPVPGRPANLDYSRARARASVLAEGAGGRYSDIFPLIYHITFLSPSLWVLYGLKYCLKGPLSPKQLTNQLWPDAYIMNADLMHKHRSTRVLYTQCT